MMIRHGLLGFLVIGASVPAFAATEIYMALGENMIPLDGVSKTPTIEMNQFFDSFSGTRFFFRVREGYESELISLGTRAQPRDSSMAVETLSESAAMSADAAAAAPETEDTGPTILGPFEIAGPYEYDIENGTDRGTDCEQATMRKVAPRTYEFNCPDPMAL